jgi:acetolactate synthase regulatory subunit
MTYHAGSAQGGAVRVEALDEGDVAHCLAVKAQAEAGLLERVVGQLSKRGLVPQRLVSVVEGEHVVLDLRVSGLEERVAQHLAERLRSVPGVESVLLCPLNGASVP